METTILLAFVAMFGMGINAVGNKLAAANGAYAPAFLLVVNVVYCVAAVVLHITQKQPFQLSPRMIALGLFVGLFGSISYICMFWAFKLGGEGSVFFPIRGLSVIVAVVLSVLLFREPITLNRLLGLILGSSAIFLLSR